ncbi:homeobox-leucine zipper protein HOX19-like [Canna indica]|uniref:Homeobox-leucine zipper protein HOX19-like n=1 Tax=Canna indica TaxID=4628 RepID=A0AAQ3Q4C4_9LILI|nr:homeobox-leucine zipper protein HOX19-like [Canna indica]
MDYLDMMRNPQDTCDAGLSLGLAIGPAAAAPPGLLRRRAARPCSEAPFPDNKPSLTLSLSDGSMRDEEAAALVKSGRSGPAAQLPSPCSAVSSFSAAYAMSSVKREKDAEEAEAERGSSRGSDEEEDNSSARKKLRLTKEQSALLEDRFKEHSTLNPKQKQALAKQLNLRPRQVEVWFQNRRARTKLKQTEVDCEFLKRCYETLTTENQRLQKELQELKALKTFSAPSAPLYMQFPAATLTMCPSCERIGGSGGGGGGGGVVADGSKVGGAGAAVAVPSKMFNPFTHSSAAC